MQVNPYDPCVANKQIDGHQVVWHVDDLKVSHKKPEEITKLAIHLSKIYGDFKVKWGHILEYLGMTLDYTIKGQVKVSMIPYIQNIIKELPKEIMSFASTPASDHLFQVQDQNAVMLPEEQAIAFHHKVAQLLFVSAKAWQDIQAPVAFVTTWVKGPDEDDWGKLKRVLKYLKGTQFLKLTLQPLTLDIV